MQYSRYILWSILCVVLLTQCKQEAQQGGVMSLGNEGVNVEVTYGAGDAYDAQGVKSVYLPLPFNLAQAVVGESDTLDFLILSDRIYKGQELQVLPIGALLLEDEGVDRDLFISIPANPKRKTFNKSMFNDFAVEHASVKWMIEQYFVNAKGFSKVKLRSWEDEQYAIRNINALTKAKNLKN